MDDFRFFFSFLRATSVPHTRAGTHLPHGECGYVFQCISAQRRSVSSLTHVALPRLSAMYLPLSSYKSWSSRSPSLISCPPPTFWSVRRGGLELIERGYKNNQNVHLPYLWNVLLHHKYEGLTDNNFNMPAGAAAKLLWRMVQLHLSVVFNTEVGCSLASLYKYVCFCQGGKSRVYR